MNVRVLSWLQLLPFSGDGGVDLHLLRQTVNIVLSPPDTSTGLMSQLQFRISRAPIWCHSSAGRTRRPGKPAVASLATVSTGGPLWGFYGSRGLKGGLVLLKGRKEGHKPASCPSLLLYKTGPGPAEGLLGPRSSPH